MMTRRQAIKTTALASAAFATLPGAVAQTTTTLPGAVAQEPIKLSQPLITTAGSGPFTLPPLPYAYDALEPYIDGRTMEIHHENITLPTWRI
jgi:Fe-Mn family superoxide dismutase